MGLPIWTLGPTKVAAPPCGGRGPGPRGGSLPPAETLVGLVAYGDGGQGRRQPRAGRPRMGPTPRSVRPRAGPTPRAAAAAWEEEFSSSPKSPYPLGLLYKPPPSPLLETHKFHNLWLFV